MSGDAWLVVGLGNPDADYGGTRHNVGAEVATVLAERRRGNLSPNKKVRCAVAEIRDGGERLVVARPLSYMNESGGPVRHAADWFSIPVERIVVLHDDLDLDVGVIRLKRGGGAGGHNGLRSLDQHLPSRDYLRARIGVGRPDGRRSARDHVLSRFTSDEREEIDIVVEETADAVLGLVHDGLEATQNRVHSRQRD